MDVCILVLVSTPFLALCDGPAILAICDASTNEEGAQLVAQEEPEPVANLPDAEYSSPVQEVPLRIYNFWFPSISLIWVNTRGYFAIHRGAPVPLSEITFRLFFSSTRNRWATVRQLHAFDSIHVSPHHVRIRLEFLQVYTRISPLILRVIVLSPPHQGCGIAFPAKVAVFYFSLGANCGIGASGPLYYRL